MGLAPAPDTGGPGSQDPDEWQAESLATDGSLLDLIWGEARGTLRLAQEGRRGTRSCSRLFTEGPRRAGLPVGESCGGGVVDV